MAVVYKYSVFYDGIDVPVGTVVGFDYDNVGVLSTWVNHSSDDIASGDKMRLYVVSTGAAFSDNDIHVSMFIDPNGFVWHLIMKWDDDV